ncbi:PKD1L3 [Branchiostoma lanceolatum]|uniref:PKD1L3 protein n=1 Tax=Branchiostoma lanceolatum TaxID=7740 RepID=A0A8J9ZGU7_BRALA|nr:PKD1L3 [Branchiostoma lanceolatum]
MTTIGQETSSCGPTFPKVCTCMDGNYDNGDTCTACTYSHDVNTEFCQGHRWFKTQQSSDSAWGSAQVYAELAFDGLTQSRWPHCASTNLQNQPWWRVDLDTPRSVDSVAVLNRYDCCSERLEGFKVYIGDNPVVTANPSCGGPQSATSKVTIFVDCGGLRGRYLGIALPAKKESYYVSLGCWKEGSEHAIPTLEGTDARLDGSYQERENAIKKCYLVALSNCYPVFAVKNGGSCTGSAEGIRTYNRYGSSTACEGDGKGGPGAIEVYRITGHPLPTEPCSVIDTGCILKGTSRLPDNQTCSVKVDIHEGTRSKISPLVVHRTGNVTIHGILSLEECTEEYELDLNWSLRRETMPNSQCPKTATSGALPSGSAYNKLQLLLRANTMDVGLYMVQFRVTMRVNGRSNVFIATAQTWVEFTRRPIVATVGSSVRTVPATGDIRIDAGLSYDPEGVLNTDTFVYDWACRWWNCAEGFYTIRLSDVSDNLTRISEWRFHVYANPTAPSAEDGDFTGVCALLPAEEFTDSQGPVETEVTLDLATDTGTLATVKFPGNTPTTNVQNIRQQYRHWVPYTSMFDVSPGTVVIHIRVSGVDGRFIEFDLPPAQNQEATTVGFQALDIMDDIYINNLFPEYPDRHLFADISMRQFLESNFNPYEYSNNSHAIRSDVIGLNVKCGNITIPVSGLSEPIDILTRRKNESLEESVYVFQATSQIGNLTAGIGILPGHVLNSRKECQYVYTGYGPNAGTTAEVRIALNSLYEEATPFTLRDRRRFLFEKGSVDSFLVSTERPLGGLTHVRVWHDSSGHSPGCARDMNDDHVWFSVLGRPARSPFTRVQRLSCCLTLLYCTMFTNIMFFGRGDDFDPPAPIRFAGLIIKPPISWAEVMIGIQSTVIILPINLLIVFLFRHSPSTATLGGKDSKTNTKAKRVMRENNTVSFSSLSDDPDVPTVWSYTPGFSSGQSVSQRRTLPSSTR